MVEKEQGCEEEEEEEKKADTHENDLKAMFGRPGAVVACMKMMEDLFRLLWNHLVIGRAAI